MTHDLARLAVTLNLPPELADTTSPHDLAELLDAPLDPHDEPAVRLLLDRLTAEVLHPALREKGITNVEDYTLTLEEPAR